MTSNTAPPPGLFIATREARASHCPGLLRLQGLLCLFALQHKVTGGDSANGVLGCLTSCSERGPRGSRGGSPEGGSPEWGVPRGRVSRGWVSRGQVSRVQVSRGGTGSLHHAARSSHGPFRVRSAQGWGSAAQRGHAFSSPAPLSAETLRVKRGAPRNRLQTAEVPGQLVKLLSSRLAGR